MEIPKYVTQKGKIFRERFYEIKNELLTVVFKLYCYYGAFKTTTQYSTDKYGFFKVINQNSESINSNMLSDRYIKMPEAPSPAKE